MKDFEEVLQIIGGRNIELLKETINWDFWSVQFPTPAGAVKGYYLYLKFKCPMKEATGQNLKFWARLSENRGYDIVVPPKSSLAQSHETKENFKGKRVLSAKTLIQESIFSDMQLQPLEEEPYFIDPDLELKDGTVIKEATKFLTDWFIPSSTSSESTRSLGILRANAGVGKTTLARILTNRVYGRDKTTIPLLVESEQWRSFLTTDIQLSNIWDIAITRAFQKANSFLSSELAFPVLIREGIFVIIFDGFDELCLNPSTSFKPADLINNFIDMLGSEEIPGHSRIMLTTRETFWQSISDDVDMSKIDLFLLRGFSNEQRKTYFNKRLSDPSERDTALRIASQISGRMYDGLSTEVTHMMRPGGVPFILDMIANYVKDNPNASVNPYQADPLAPLLEAICKRENIRQNLNIPYDKQIILFEELFREFNEVIPYENLKEYLSVFCDVQDERVVNSISNHFFLIRKDKDRFAPRHEVLKVYFIARFLAKSLTEVTKIPSDRKKFAEILAMQSSGNTQIADWLVNQLVNLPQDRLVMAIKHALEIINEPDNLMYRKTAGSALFNIVLEIIRVLEKRGAKDIKDKADRRNLLASYIGAQAKDGMIIFKKLSISGNLNSFDFSNCKFIECIITNVDFKNCIFNNFTTFIDCNLEGELRFTSCKGENLIIMENCKCSKEVELLFDSLYQRRPRPEIMREFGEEALVKALRKFKKQFGYRPLDYSNRLKGMPQHNPFSNTIWEVLESNGVIQKNKRAGASEAWFHLTENHDIRREVITFLDNGYLGGTLKKVLMQLIDKKS